MSQGRVAKRKRGGRSPGWQAQRRESSGVETEDRHRWVGIAAAALAVLGFLTLLRLLAPNPWDYDEYFHVGVARELHKGMPASFQWTPFSIAYERFADKELLFHVLLMPFTGLSIERAGLAGAFLGQLVVLVLVGSLFTFIRLRQTYVGQLAPPRGMALWLAEHGRRGERVFTANWADSEPLFYYAPHLQSLVALDPTFFLIADPERFRQYVDIVKGREAEPARAIRERFDARWVTIWKVPSYRKVANQLVRSGQARVVFSDPFYFVLDLGEPVASSPRPVLWLPPHMPAAAALPPQTLFNLPRRA